MSTSQKLRILYLMKTLLEETDETHQMSANKLMIMLENYGITSDRKTIYSDIDVLQTFGLDIVQQKGTNAGYYIGAREFELPELKLLVDAVQASKFITRKKSEELIKKLETLTSVSNAKQLRRNVFIYNRPKTGNETIYYNVDQIHAAILENKQISFHYGEWTIKKELRLKKGGEKYQVSPWQLTWDDENYYLIAYDELANQIKHYRVDKMLDMDILLEDRCGKDKFLDFDLAAFAKKTFAMYGGTDHRITLLCHNDIVGVVIDRFGKDVILKPKDQEHFTVTVTIAVSSQFFGWVTGVGSKMKIIGPESVCKEYQEYLHEILGGYQ